MSRWYWGERINILDKIMARLDQREVLKLRELVRNYEKKIETQDKVVLSQINQIAASNQRIARCCNEFLELKNQLEG